MTSFEVLQLSNYLQWFGSFSIVFSAILVLRLRVTKEILIIAIYGANSFLAQSIQTGFVYFKGIQYLNVVGNIYVLTETVVLLYLFYVVTSNKVFRYLILVFALGFTIFWLIVFSNDPAINSASYRTIRDVLMIVCSLEYFFFLLKYLPEDNLIKLPMFWVASGILFFFSCTFMLSLTQDYIREIMKNDFGTFWTFRNLLRAFFCVVICIGIWKARVLSKRAELT